LQKNRFISKKKDDPLFSVEMIGRSCEKEICGRENREELQSTKVFVDSHPEDGAAI
jgi:hypothetical protein